MIRAVLDANVFVSGILSPMGVPARVLEAWRDEQFQLVISQAILDEIARVLRYPRISKRHGWSSKRIEIFVEDLRHLGILTPGEVKFEVVKEDSSDNRYLECAVEGDAAFIVSGDQHLLGISEFQDARILNPVAFLDVLEQRTTPTQ